MHTALVLFLTLSSLKLRTPLWRVPPFGAAPDPDSFLPQAPDSTSLGPVPNSFLPQAPDSAILCSVPDSFLPQAPDSAILCLVPNSFLPQAPDYYIVQCAIKC